MKGAKREDHSKIDASGSKYYACNVAIGGEEAPEVEVCDIVRVSFRFFYHPITDSKAFPSETRDDIAYCAPNEHN